MRPPQAHVDELRHSAAVLLIQRHPEPHARARSAMPPAPRISTPAPCHFAMLLSLRCFLRMRHADKPHYLPVRLKRAAQRAATRRAQDCSRYTSVRALIDVRLSPFLLTPLCLRHAFTPLVTPDHATATDIHARRCRYAIFFMTFSDASYAAAMPCHERQRVRAASRGVRALLPGAAVDSVLCRTATQRARIAPCAERSACGAGAGVRV